MTHATQERAIASKGSALTPDDAKSRRVQNRDDEACTRAPVKALERELGGVLKDE